MFSIFKGGIDHIMSTINPAGDTLTQHSVNAICNEIEKLDSKSQKQDDMLNQLQETLALILRKHISITVNYSKRQFPQLYTEDGCLYIKYNIESSIYKVKQSSIFLQLSIASVLACCPDSFVDDCIALDETFCTFSQNWPNYANLATKLHNIILSKIIPE